MEKKWAEVKADAPPSDTEVDVGAVRRRAARRSLSLMPEAASTVRRAGYTLSLRQGGFRSLVLGKGLDLAAEHDLAAAFGQDFPVKSPSTLPRRSSKGKVAGHKRLSFKTSDPTTSTSKQCVSCGEHPDQCLTALGLFEACDPHHHPSHTASSTPKRTHSLLRRSRHPPHPSRRPFSSLSSRQKPKSILEEGGEGDGDAGNTDNEAQTPDSEVCTPEGSSSTPVNRLRSTVSSTNTEEENRHENRMTEAKTTPRALRLPGMGSATFGEEDDERDGSARRGETRQRRGEGANKVKADLIFIKTIRRLSI